MKDQASSSSPEMDNTSLTDSLPFQILIQSIDMISEHSRVKLHTLSGQKLLESIDKTEGSDARICLHRIITDYSTPTHSVRRTDSSLVVLQSAPDFKDKYGSKLQYFRPIDTASLLKIEREIEHISLNGNPEENKKITFGVRHFIDTSADKPSYDPYILDYYIQNGSSKFKCSIYYQDDGRSFMANIDDNAKTYAFSLIGGVRLSENTDPRIADAIHYMGEGYLNNISWNLLVGKFLKSIGQPLSDSPIHDLI
jgi:hypothetical protein